MGRWWSWLRGVHVPPRLAALVVLLAMAVPLAVALPRLREPQRIIQPEPVPPLPGKPLDEDRSVGSAQVFDNLTVFPIYARDPDDEREFTTLEQAIGKGEAEVRELGSADAAADAGAADEQRPLDAAQVGKLEIENKGNVPIMLLAGTILRGGKQDRQVGEDLVIAPHTTTAVAAFCVERGRWNGTREGVATDGKFTVEKTLATGAVRAAGQYEGNQGEVWNKVAEVNAANHKDAPSGTLLATISDAELSARRQDLAARTAQALRAVEQPDRVVGIAYAIDGAVRGVRWFAGRRLFALHLDTLLHTAALEALTAQGRAQAAGVPVHKAPAAPEAATAFVKEMEAASVAEHKKGSGHSKAYKKGSSGYASELVLEAPSAGSAHPSAKPKATSITKDFVLK